MARGDRQTLSGRISFAALRFFASLREIAFQSTGFAKTHKKPMELLTAIDVSQMLGRKFARGFDSFIRVEEL